MVNIRNNRMVVRAKKLLFAYERRELIYMLKRSNYLSDCSTMGGPTKLSYLQSFLQQKFILMASGKMESEFLNQ